MFFLFLSIEYIRSANRTTMKEANMAEINENMSKYGLTRMVTARFILSRLWLAMITHTWR